MFVAKAQDELKALQLCQSKVKAKKLPMEVIDAEYQWCAPLQSIHTLVLILVIWRFRDRRKLTFYFIAEKRIDFRELVRELFRCVDAESFLLVFGSD
jgi:cell fate regulator YaaT (PSP1 superfamily)